MAMELNVEVEVVREKEVMVMTEKVSEEVVEVWQKSKKK